MSIPSSSILLHVASSTPAAYSLTSGTTTKSSSLKKISTSGKIPANHPSLEKRKVSQHIWNSIFMPLLPQNEQQLHDSPPISWEFSDEGKLVITLQTENFTSNATIELLCRIKLNPRTQLDTSTGKAIITIENHHFPHLFFDKPE